MNVLCRNQREGTHAARTEFYLFIRHLSRPCYRSIGPHFCSNDSTNQNFRGSIVSGNNKSLGGKQGKIQQKLWYYILIYPENIHNTFQFQFQRGKNNLFDYVLFNKDKINTNWNLKYYSAQNISYIFRNLLFIYSLR